MKICNGKSEPDGVVNSQLLRKATDIAYTLYDSVVWHRSTHFAFLIHKNEICWIGWNKAKTHPIAKRHPYRKEVYLHAEMDCIIKPKQEDLSAFQMLVLRIDRNMKLNNSKPCSGCASVIKQFGISEVYWSLENGQFIGECDYDFV